MSQTFDLGPHYEDLLRKLVDAGRYSSASEAVRDSLRLLEDQEARRDAKLQRLRAEIQRGQASGPAEVLDIAAIKKTARASGGR